MYTHTHTNTSGSRLQPTYIHTYICMCIDIYTSMCMCIYQRVKAPADKEVNDVTHVALELRGKPSRNHLPYVCIYVCVHAFPQSPAHRPSICITAP